MAKSVETIGGPSVNINLLKHLDWPKTKVGTRSHLKRTFDRYLGLIHVDLLETHAGIIMPNVEFKGHPARGKGICNV